MISGGALGRRDDSDQRIQAAHPAVAVTGTLLLVSVDLLDGVVDPGQGVVVDPGHDRGDRADVDQPPPGHDVELADVTEREGPQERSQRRWRVRSREQLLQPAVAQQKHVVDRVSAGEHPRDQRGDLQPRVRPEIARQRQPRISQVTKARPDRQRHRWDQTRGRHQVRIVEGRGQPAGAMEELHLRGVLLVGQIGCCGKPYFP